MRARRANEVFAWQVELVIADRVSWARNSAFAVTLKVRPGLSTQVAGSFVVQDWAFAEEPVALKE